MIERKNGKSVMTLRGSVQSRRGLEGSLSLVVMVMKIDGACRVVEISPVRALFRSG